MSRQQNATLEGLVARGGTDDTRIDRYTIDSGGVMRSEAGDIELSGTVGQPVVGVMNSDGLELVGGFWFGLEPTDCDDDGLVSLADFATMRSCMTGPGQAVHSDCRCFDIDRNGAVDIRDFAECQLAFD